jgi:hypothetical protein
MNLHILGSGLALGALLMGCGGPEDELALETTAQTSQGLQARVRIPPRLVGPCTPADPRFWYDKPDLTFTDDAVEIKIDGHVFRNVPWGGAVYLPIWNETYTPHHVRFRATVVNDSCQNYTSAHWQGNTSFEFFTVSYYIDNNIQYPGHNFTLPFYGQSLRETYTSFIDSTGTRLFDLYGTGFHRLTFKVDSNNSVAEWDEKNNERYIWLYVYRPYQLIAGRN